ncbi:MAG: hypothetical protein M1530_04210, partial [Candidatus Marsarchaeota archaeon]|nr:hypothetical protein [Candidatus Marsarchaeota archaeon]
FEIWVHALSLQRLSLSALFTFSNPSIPAVQFGMEYLNPARRGIYQFSAEADWKPLEAVFDDFWASLRVHPYFKYAWFPTSDTPWLQGPGGSLISGGLRLSFELAPPVKSETADTYDTGMRGTRTTQIDCNGLVNWKQQYDAAWSKKVDGK